VNIVVSIENGSGWAASPCLEPIQTTFVARRNIAHLLPSGVISLVFLGSGLFCRKLRKWITGENYRRFSMGSMGTAYTVSR
jgi:hypothetical protein